jgi:homoserine/homoserine lactone efflux protein
MSFELWAVYALAALALSLTPGPNGLLALNHAVRFGFRRTVFTALGSIAGMLLLIAASMAGLGALMLTSEVLFTVVKWLGAGYLVWLGLSLWRAPAPAVALRQAAGLEAISRRRAGTHGMLVALSNPKALLFFATFLPQFMQPGVPLWLQFVIFGGTFAVIEFSYELFLAGAARRLAGWLTRHGRIFNRLTGCAFIGVGGMVLMSQRG